MTEYTAPEGRRVRARYSRESPPEIGPFGRVSSLGGDIIEVHEDRAKIVVDKHIQTYESRSAWLGPGGIAVSIVLTMGSATFKKWVFEPHQWQIFYCACLILVLGWTSISVYRAFKSPGRDKLIENIVNALKSRDS